MTTKNLMMGSGAQDPGSFTPDWKVRSVFGARALFCSPACADSFRCDRRHGLIYPPYDISLNSDGSEMVSVHEASIAAEFCAYCGDDKGRWFDDN